VKDLRTKRTAHFHIERHWAELKDGDVVDVQFILNETDAPKFPSASVMCWNRIMPVTRIDRSGYPLIYGSSRGVLVTPPRL
jgi:hypothetical protein